MTQDQAQTRDASEQRAEAIEAQTSPTAAQPPSVQEAPADQRQLPALWYKLALAFLALSTLLILFGRQRSVGIWEPWEAQEIFLAQEYATRAPFQDPEALKGYNWAVPTSNGAPAATSLLKLWLIGLGAPAKLDDVSALIGGLEFGSRLPVAALALLMVLALWRFGSRQAGPLAGLLMGAAFVGMPVIAAGVYNLASPALSITVQGFAALALFMAMRHKDKGAKLAFGWAAVAGLALGISFFDQRFLGVMFPLEVLLLLGLSELIEDEQARPGIAQRILAALLIAAPIVRALIAYGHEDPTVGGLSAPHIRQQLYVMGHLGISSAALVLGLKTSVGRLLVSAHGAILLGIAALFIAPTLIAYADVNPTLLDHGKVVGKIPVLSFLLEQQLGAKSFGKEHVHFDLWVRQIGFGSYPWFALIPAALAYLVRGDELRDERGLSPQRRSLERFLIGWAGLGLVVTATSSLYGHVYYLAYVPLAVALGLMLSDAYCWAQLRRRPLLLYAIGFVAVAIIMTLGKDIERYPNRFLELYMGFEKDLKLPEGFSYSRAHKPMKYALALAMIAATFGLTSWAALWFKRRGQLKQELKTLIGAQPAPDQGMMYAQAEAKEELRLHGQDPLSKLARLIETPPTQPLWIGALMSLCAIVVVFRYLPAASDHLSQRHIFESYIKSAKDPKEAPLYRYQAPADSASIYLKDVPQLGSSQELIERFKDDKPNLFAIIPRERLAAVNAEVREALGKNVHVLNARSNRLVLISDALPEGQEDQNYISKSILNEEQLKAQLDHDVKFPSDTQGAPDQHLTMDGQLEFMGYSLNHKAGADGITDYKWQEKMELSLYFKVLKRIPGNKKIFLHIDTQGNRLNGDHDPVGGELPTMYWLPGDIIKDTHTIDVESYTTRGVYTIFMGFYQGNDRMKVVPKRAHDGVNRIPVGKIRVK